MVVNIVDKNSGVFTLIRMLDYNNNNNNTRLTTLCVGLPGWAGTRKSGFTGV